MATGSLTQAIINGLWVVFEDIDKAPADVQSILLPLLEGASSFLTGHGEAIRVSEGFRLFSIVSSSRLDASTVTTGRNSLGALWRRVMIGPSSSSDLHSIVKAWYPDLESLCGKLIETFEKVNQLAGFQLSASVTFSSAGRFSLRQVSISSKDTIKIQKGNISGVEIMKGIKKHDKILQEEYGNDDSVQQGVELLVTSFLKIYENFQVAYKGQIVGVVIMNVSPSKESDIVYTVRFGSQSSPRLLEEKNGKQDSTKISQVRMAATEKAEVGKILKIKS